MAKLSIIIIIIYQIDELSDLDSKTDIHNLSAIGNWRRRKVFRLVFGAKQMFS